MLQLVLNSNDHQLNLYLNNCYFLFTIKFDHLIVNEHFDKLSIQVLLSFMTMPRQYFIICCWFLFVTLIIQFHLLKSTNIQKIILLSSEFCGIQNFVIKYAIIVLYNCLFSCKFLNQINCYFMIHIFHQ